MTQGPLYRLGNFLRYHHGWRWFIAVMVILFASYTILVPVIAHWQIEKWLKENGEDRVRIEGVTFNPFIMRLRVHSLFAEGPGAGKLRWKRLAFETNLWPLYRRRVIIEDFILRDAMFTVQQTERGDWVIGGIRFRVGDGQGAGERRGKRRWDVGLSNLELTNVQIYYRGPFLHQEILIREAKVDTFKSWQPNSKSQFSIQALISGGSVSISGNIDPQGGSRSVASTINIESLPLQWLSPSLDSIGFPGVDGVIDANVRLQGTLQAKNRYSLDATGRMNAMSVKTGVAALPYAVDVSRIFYNGTFRMTDSIAWLYDDLVLTNVNVRDTVRHLLVLQLETGNLRGVKAQGASRVTFGNVRMQGLKSFAYVSPSQPQNVGPFAIQAGVANFDSISIAGKRQEISIGSIALQALNATFVREQDGGLRIMKQLPLPKKEGQQPKRGQPAPPVIAINRLIINGQSRVELLDLSMSPRVALQATDLNFELNEFSSIENRAPGEYNLTATIPPEASLRAHGTLGSLFPKLTTEINSQLEDFSLPKLTNYMRSLFGYEINAGRLAANMSGNIKQGQLSLVSQITVNKLEITSMPSELAYEQYKNAFAGLSLESALSIITDQQGDVKLSVPINGNLSDPQFNIANVIRTAIINSVSGGFNSVFMKN